MSTTPRLWLKRLGLGLVSTLFTLLLAEGVLRLLDIGDPILRDVDPVLGWAPIPGAEGRWTREGEADVAITEHGFRGVTVDSVAKPAGTLRVALLGDSYVEARQVALEDTVGALLEARLNDCVDAPVEVLAFGVSGYGPAQERLLLEHRVWPFEPDVVLAMVLTGNDISDDHPDLRISGDPAPYYRLVDGELVLDASFTEDPDYLARADGGALRALRRRSRLARLLSSIGRTPHHEARGELGLRDEIYAPPADDTWRDAWARTEAILAAMHDDVTARGATFGVVTLTNAIQVEPDRALRRQVAARLGVDDLDYPDRRIAEAGARDGYDVLGLVEPLRAHAARHVVDLHGFENTAMGTGHWNERGHEVAARAIAAWLCPRLEPP